MLCYGCKKTSSIDNNPADDWPAAITPVGTTVGTPITKTIGTAGGTLVSPDGRLELSIPAGALSGNTGITIQPVTNEPREGLGLLMIFCPMAQHSASLLR